MAISGLVLRLREDAHAVERAVAALSRDPRLVLGRIEQRCLPLVAETPSAAEDATLWADLLATPGVVSVDVTFVSVEPPQTTDVGVGSARED
jgi:hypothetical protein